MSWKVRQSPDEGRARKFRLWRRRVLLKKGARLHAQMRANSDDGSLAMLDEEGIVISWYGDGADDTRADRRLDPCKLPESGEAWRASSSNAGTTRAL